MPPYVRAFVPGGTLCFTASPLERRHFVTTCRMAPAGGNEPDTATMRRVGLQ